MTEPKPGRTRIDPDDARTVRLTMLVSPAENMAICRLRGDVPVSAWLRRIVLNAIETDSARPYATPHARLDTTR